MSDLLTITAGVALGDLLILLTVAVVTTFKARRVAKKYIAGAQTTEREEQFLADFAKLLENSGDGTDSSKA